MNEHNRRSIRIKSYDYSQTGAYFVTICVKDRKLYFEKYPKLKEIVEKQWLDIPNRFQNIELYEYTIMPNHFHGIIFIKNTVGATLAVAQNDVITANNIRAGASPAPTVGEIVGSFKSLCVNYWLKYIKENNIKETGKFWQRNYYEHVIRDEKDFNEIREYIINNPLKWQEYTENPKKMENLTLPSLRGFLLNRQIFNNEFLNIISVTCKKHFNSQKFTIFIYINYSIIIDFFAF